MKIVSCSTFYLSVIPACRESFLKKDFGQAEMTEKSGVFSGENFKDK